MNPESAKAALLQLKDELTGRVERTHKHIHGREERVSADFAEQSSEMENQELVMSLDAEGRGELRMIEAALARIANNTYGTCTQCGAQVGDERLKALPYAALCINCARADGD